MFSKLGVGEIALILIVLLLIFGPSKLPQLGRSIGDSLREFKKSVRSDDSGEKSEAKEPSTKA